MTQESCIRRPFDVTFLFESVLVAESFATAQTIYQTAGHMPSVEDILALGVVGSRVGSGSSTHFKWKSYPETKPLRLAGEFLEEEHSIPLR